MTGRWVVCTPAWVAHHPQACGSTVRRPILIECTLPQVRALHTDGQDPVYHQVGHEHLVESTTDMPITHESGEPA